MEDKVIYNFLDNKGEFVPIKAIDNGDGSYCLFNGTNFTDITLSDMILGNPLYQTVVDAFSQLNSSGIFSGGSLTVVGSNVSYSDILGFIKISNSENGNIKFFSLPSSSISLTDNSINYIYVDYNNGTPQVVVTTDDSNINLANQFPIGSAYSLDGNIKVVQSGVLLANYQRKHYERLLSRSTIEHMSGAMIAEKATRYVTITAGLYYIGLNRIETAAQDSSLANFDHYYYRSSILNWSELDATGQINNSQYNRLSDYTLQSLGWLAYGVHWIYQGYDGKLSVVLGNDSYSAGDADLAQPPSELPDYLNKFGILVGKIIIKKSASTFTSVDSQLDNIFIPIAVNNHNDLGGLQGGSLDQYYHLQATERELLTDLDASSLLGNSGSSSGVASSITLGSGLTFDGNSLKVTGTGSLPEGIAGDVLKHDGVDWVADGIYRDVVKEPTGFENRTDSTITWDNDDMELTITGTFDIYIGGVKYTKTTASVAITNTVGLWFIYYDDAGVLTASQTIWDLSSYVPLATVYWNGTNGVVGDERHGCTMDWATHSLIHKTIGTRYTSGLTGTFGNTTFSITAGVVSDEDIDISIPLSTYCRVFYRSGSAFTFTAAQTTYYYTSGGNVYYDNSGVLTAVPSNQYVAYWVFGTNDIDYPIWVLMGQRVDNTLANARNNNKYESLSLGNLPFAEMKLLYRVILRNDATPYEETQDLRSVSNLPAGTFVATAHGALTGLDYSTAGHTGFQADLGGTLTGDFTRYNAVTGLWEVASEPLELKGIVLTPATAALVEVEGSLYYNSITKTINICIDS